MSSCRPYLIDQPTNLLPERRVDGQMNHTDIGQLVRNGCFGIERVGHVLTQNRLGDQHESIPQGNVTLANDYETVWRQETDTLDPQAQRQLVRIEQNPVTAKDAVGSRSTAAKRRIVSSPLCNRRVNVNDTEGWNQLPGVRASITSLPSPSTTRSNA